MRVIDKHKWFIARQQLFASSLDKELQDTIYFAEETLRLQFDIREQLVNLLRQTEDETVDTMSFFLDSQIEDFQSIVILCRRGLFSSSACLLRRILLSLAKTVYLNDHPEQASDLWAGAKQKDRDLMEYLEASGISKDDKIYGLLCESTHLNVAWASSAKHAHFLSKPNQKNYLLLQSVVQTAQSFCLRTLMIIAQFLAARNNALPDTISQQLVEFTRKWHERYNSFLDRMQQVMPE